MNEQKHIIWSSDVDYEDWRADLEEQYPDLSEQERMELMVEQNNDYLDEVRNDDDQCGLPVEIGRWVMVNHWGTLLSATPIELEPNKYNNNAYRSIDPEKDWNYTGEPWTVREYMDNYLPKKEREKPRER